MDELQSIYPKNRKQITHESNKLCMLETVRKNHCQKVLKRVKAILGDKLAMSIR